MKRILPILLLTALPAWAQDACQDLQFVTMCDPEDRFADYTDDAGAVIPGEYQYDADTDAIVSAFPNESGGALTVDMMIANLIAFHAEGFGLTIEESVGHGGQPIRLPGEDSITAAYSFVLDGDSATYLTSVQLDDEAGVFASTIHYGAADDAGVTPERLAVHEALLGTVARK